MITLNGVPLLYPDTAAGLLEWQEQFQRLRDVHLFGCEPIAVRSSNKITRSELSYGVPLPSPNFPDLPEPRLNTLYWPTGASRWARGYFLTTGDQLQNFQPSTGTGNVPLSLVMGDDVASNTIQASVYLLPPRCVTVPTAPPAEQLWLLPVVDRRYWWQCLNTGSLSITTSTMWGDLFNTLSAQLGVTVVFDTVVAAYLQPSAVELNRNNFNAAVMLDAVSSCVGQRVVVNLDGSVWSQSAGTAAGIYAQNATLDQWTQAAGGDFSAQSGKQPAQVTVTYPKYRQGVGYCEGTRVTYSNSAPSGIVTSGTTKTIASSVFADFGTGSSFPDNDSNLSRLAAQVATDYYAWLGLAYDETFNSAKRWQFSGFDDFVAWTFGGQLDDGDGTYLASTRVQSMPFDFGVGSQLSQDPALNPLPHFVIGKISGTDLAPGSGGSVVVWDTTPGSEVSLGITINNVYSWTADTIPEGHASLVLLALPGKRLVLLQGFELGRAVDRAVQADEQPVARRERLGLDSDLEWIGLRRRFLDHGR